MRWAAANGWIPALTRPPVPAQCQLPDLPSIETSVSPVVRSPPNQHGSVPRGLALAPLCRRAGLLAHRRCRQPACP
eukprot:scaffold43690_cov69-Phaeocystis_antarctica.AAC.3